MDDMLIMGSNRHFNPRTREGCDSNNLRKYYEDWMNFNPRTREGCDLTGRY